MKHTTQNPTIIPVMVRTVRELAIEELKYQESRIHRDLAEAGRTYIDRLESKNNTFFRRIGIIKREEIPSLETVVQDWKDIWLKNRYYGGFYSYAGPKMILDRTVSNWWQRLTFFSKLPESQDDDIMYLSIDDAKLIKYVKA